MPPAVIISDAGMLSPGSVTPTPVPAPDNGSQPQPPGTSIDTTDPDDTTEPEPGSEPDPTPDPFVTITISAAGDVTLGGDYRPGSYQNFMNEFVANDRDFGFPFQNVRHIFAEDDLTVVNFEGTLTNLTRHRSDRNFVFRAPPEFAMSLVLGNIDIVSLANNHSNDYYDAGYHETIEHLDNAGILSFGNERNTIVEVKGINIGFFGICFFFTGDTREQRDNIIAAIEDLKDRGANLIIAFFHWGEQGHTRPSRLQRDIGRFTVDNGADLVLGSHPHMIQGIEVYNGRNIVYSLADFSFGGNRLYHVDGDNIRFYTFIFQQTFTFIDGVLQQDNMTNIIPARITSHRNHNNYQPTPAEGELAARILSEIQKLSDELN